jgi:hypothetical protein
MPDPYTPVVSFVFSIAIEGRVHVVGNFISEMHSAGITVQNLSGFVSGRRHHLFCVPTNVDKFRAFAKKRKLRLREKSAFKITRTLQPVMNVFHKLALSSDTHPAWSISSQIGFVYLPVKRH